MSDNLCAVCGQAPRNPLANVCQSCSDEIERRQARHTCPACEAATEAIEALIGAYALLLDSECATERNPHPSASDPTIQLAQIRLRAMRKEDER